MGWVREGGGGRGGLGEGGWRREGWVGLGEGGRVEEGGREGGRGRGGLDEGGWRREGWDVQLIYEGFNINSQLVLLCKKRKSYCNMYYNTDFYRQQTV